MADLSPRALRNTLGAYPTGMVLIAAEVDEQAVGIIANSFTSVSLDPPLVSLSFDHSSSTWPKLSRASRIGISVLSSEDRNLFDLLRRPAAKRFEGIELLNAEGGALLLPNAAASLVVSRHSEFNAGDHAVAFFQILEHSRDIEAAPLVFHGGQMQDLAQYHSSKIPA